ncbi:MAG: dipeptide ABC transporter ATP-binding protein [Desulfatirhabdiaceae bacterium]
MGPYKILAVQDMSLRLAKGMRLGIVGESGSGKTTLALAIMGLLDQGASVNGSIRFAGTDLQQLSEKQRNPYRWSRIALVFQNSLDVLNPVLTVHDQIYECLVRHTSLTHRDAHETVVSLLESVGMASEHGQYYPHQLSGGMRQRVLLAMALSCEPDVLILDEPTNALDAVTKTDIIDRIARIQQERQFGLIVISHELQTIARLTSRISVMYRGRILEEGPTGTILSLPLHPYTRGLVQASPDINPWRDMWGIPEESETSEFSESAESFGNSGCPFVSRCCQKTDICQTHVPSLEPAAPERQVACNRGGIVTLLQGTGIHKHFGLNGTSVQACQDCCIRVRSGEAAVLIGESGSGKTTLANILSGILNPDRGDIRFNGETVVRSRAGRRKKGMQIIFQDPYSAINANLGVEQAIREPLDILGQDLPEHKTASVIRALQQVGLPVDDHFRRRKCHTLSGGQRQRIAIARALVMDPAMLIADEISAMLDPSTQANILRLLKGLQNHHGFAMLYITHDLAVAQKIADWVYVMNHGKIVEQGDARQIFTNPAHPFTRKLVGQHFPEITRKTGDIPPSGVKNKPYIIARNPALAKAA